MDTKICTKCGEEKPATAEYFFADSRGKYGRVAMCKPCCAAANRRRYTAEKERARYLQRKDKHYQAVQRWRRKNADKVAEYCRRYRASAKGKATKAGYVRRRRGESLEFRLVENLRQRAAKAVVRYAGRRFSLTDFLKSQYEGLFSHLESRFLPGMEWGNYGEVWEVDHIIPLKSKVGGVPVFSLDVAEDMAVAAHRFNLQPLGLRTNRSKRSRAPRWDDIPKELQDICTPRIRDLLKKVKKTS